MLASFVAVFVVAAILETVVFRDLRHPSSSAEGTHPKLVQAHLGHFKISRTKDTYSHMMAGMENTAAAHMDNLLGSRTA